MNFLETNVKKWVDIVQLAEKLHGFVYRGQSNSSWQLSSSLERALKKFGKEKANLKEYEQLIMGRFKQRYHLYASNPPDEDNHLEWLAIMQHHGAPTRLLDFSYSPYMATYFATVDTNEECSVWAINKKLLNLNYQKQIKTNLKEWFPDKLFFDSDIPSNLDTINKEIGSNDLNISSHFLLDAESSRPSIRVVRQQGVFIVPISLRELNEAIKTITFKDCLWQSFGKDSEAEFEQVDIDSLLDNKSYESDVACLKINLPVEVHRSTLRQLKLMGIDGESLFPGLGGLAMSQLQQHIR